MAVARPIMHPLPVDSVELNDLPDGVFTADATGRAKMEDAFLQNAKVDGTANIALTKAATDLSNVALGVATYRIARGTVVVTGTEVVATGLATIVAAGAIARADLVITDQFRSITWAGANLTLKLWKPTAVNDLTPLAATGGLQVDWWAIGT